jgi:uncharacterized protein (DUF433 family)
MRKFIAAMAFVVLMLSTTGRPAFAHYKVDCDAVMRAFRQGKKPNEIASDLRIHENDVHRCIREAARAQRRIRPTPLPPTKK